MNVEFGFRLAELLLYLILGALAHEGGHYFFGKVFGAEPFRSRRFLILPTQTDFASPMAMSERQVQVMGGFVILFIPLSLAGAYLHFWELMAFGVGGIGISWTDLLAAYHPDEWRKFTAGEEISRDDFGWPRKGH